MLMDLPLRPTELRITVQDEPEVVMVARPLSDEQALTLKDRAEVRLEEKDGQTAITMSIPHGRMAHLVASQLIAVEGLTIAGEPVDVASAAHVLAIPRGWKVHLLSELVSEAFSAPKDLAGNSKAPAEPSQKAPTPSED
jgi:hypothetical protein